VSLNNRLLGDIWRCLLAKSEETPCKVEKRNADASKNNANCSRDKRLGNARPLCVKSKRDSAEHKERASESRSDANKDMNGSRCCVFELGAALGEE
jgi:hypothetical protein